MSIFPAFGYPEHVHGRARLAESLKGQRAAQQHRRSEAAIAWAREAVALRYADPTDLNAYMERMRVEALVIELARKVIVS